MTRMVRRRKFPQRQVESVMSRSPTTSGRGLPHCPRYYYRVRTVYSLFTDRLIKQHVRIRIKSVALLSRVSLLFYPSVDNSKTSENVVCIATSLGHCQPGLWRQRFHCEKTYPGEEARRCGHHICCANAPHKGQKGRIERHTAGRPLDFSPNSELTNPTTRQSSKQQLLRASVNDRISTQTSSKTSASATVSIQPVPMSLAPPCSHPASQQLQLPQP